jgi:hypothetical protein
LRYRKGAVGQRASISLIQGRTLLRKVDRPVLIDQFVVGIDDDVLVRARPIGVAGSSSPGRSFAWERRMIAVISTAERIRNASEISIADTGVENGG